MLVIKGKYNYAKIFLNEIDEKTKNQIKLLLDQEFIKESVIRIMPDCHCGKGSVIGLTMTLHGKVVPNLVGVDIGCGMKVVNLGNIDIDLPSLDKFIHDNIPCGMNVNKNIISNRIDIALLKCFKDLKNKTYLKKSICSLGGGNHFIEIDFDEDNNKYLIIHTGSRNLGKQVCEIYQNKAIKYQKDKLKFKINNLIEKLKKENKEKLINEKIKELKKEYFIDDDLCYLEGQLYDDYIFDMDICQKFASLNRELIAKKICKYLSLHYKKLKGFESIHNYINMNDLILRKGSIASYLGEKVIIPLNMKDGCIIARGKSNKEFNYSAPHGSGRKLSRSEAIKEISLNDFIKSMEGIYSTSIVESTKDESCFAYKDSKQIIDNILSTVEIISIIKPTYNFKAVEERKIYGKIK